MFNIISLKVKCPVCQASLMDKATLVDNAPGIKLNISIGNKKGTIWLSSIYESYNYISDFDIALNEIADFTCPHCQTKIVSDDLCVACQAPLVPFHLKDGGKVSICSRAGCKKHSVAFEDLSTALNYFYEKYSYVHTDRLQFDHSADDIQVRKIDVEVEEDKEIIKTGTFLNAYCPHCKKSLIVDRMVKLKVQNSSGETGYLLLSPYLNMFSHKSTIRLPEHQTLNSIQCPHCDRELFIAGEKCPECGSEIAKVNVTAMTKMIDFYICSKKGCTWHGVSPEDLQSIMLEDSKDW
jgi:ssDNA-binding Zn-finger/Zn-ribbon topoisomerase 1